MNTGMVGAGIMVRAGNQRTATQRTGNAGNAKRGHGLKYRVVVYQNEQTESGAKATLTEQITLRHNNNEQRQYEMSSPAQYNS